MGVRTKSKKAIRQRKVRRVFFDIETEVFSREFGTAVDNKTRLKLAPRMRVACVFDGTEYLFYEPSDYRKLIGTLNTADEVISFNGTCFDELVLRKHYGLRGNFPANGKHIDLCELIYRECGYRVSLDALTQANLKERKHKSGRAMSDLDLAALKVACNSDVSQTYRLWKMWVAGDLVIPNPRYSGAVGSDSYSIGPGEHMPTICRYCHSAYSLEMIDESICEMTDGEASDFLAGTWGNVYCRVCQHEDSYGY